MTDPTAPEPEDPPAPAEPTPWLEVTLTVTESQQELIIALLSGLGFDSFWQEEGELKAYIPHSQYDPEELGALALAYGLGEPRLQELPDINWNARWEAQVQPIRVGDLVELYPEHAQPSGMARFQLCIQPQMSFGTGHHPTTRLLIELMGRLYQEQPTTYQGVHVLDTGCGTGVLGLLALQMGAAQAHLLDVDPWAIANSRENAARNGLTAYSLQQAPLAEAPPGHYPLILANINRNILQAGAQQLRQCLAPGGHLLLSGFRPEDRPVLESYFASPPLAPYAHLDTAEWSALHLHAPA